MGGEKIVEIGNHFLAGSFLLRAVAQTDIQPFVGANPGKLRNAWDHAAPHVQSRVQAAIGNYGGTSRPRAFDMKAVPPGIHQVACHKQPSPLELTVCEPYRLARTRDQQQQTS